MDKKIVEYLLVALATLFLAFRGAVMYGLSDGLIVVLMLIFIAGEAIPVLSRFGYFSQETRASLWYSFMLVGFGALIYLSGVYVYNQFAFMTVPSKVVIGSALYIMLLAIIFYLKQQIVFSVDPSE